MSFIFIGCWSWWLLASVTDSCSFKMFTSLIHAAIQHHIFPFFSLLHKKGHPPLFLQLSATCKVSDLPIRLQRWNGYSLFGTLVGCEETPVCLTIRLGYICRGVLLRPDRWVCTTGQRWVENIHSLYWSATRNIGHGEQHSAHGILGRYLVIYF